MSDKRRLTYAPEGEPSAKRRQTIKSSTPKRQSTGGDPPAKRQKTTGSYSSRDKRSLQYTPEGERDAKRRIVDLDTFTDPEHMEVDEEEVTSPMRPAPRARRRLFEEEQPPVPMQQRRLPEPSMSGYKMSPTTKMATTYKYLHVDTSNRLTHETNSKLTVNFGGMPIENVKRVGVLKAAITNTGHNVYENHDQVKIAVRISTGEHFVTLTLAHGYYTITEMVSALNTQLQAYTNSNSTVQTAVRDLEFFENTTLDKVVIRVKSSTSTTADTAVSYALIADHKTDQANTLLFELGFDKTHQTLDPSRYTDYLAGDLHSTTHYGTIILPSQNFNGRLFFFPNSGDSRPTSLTAFHRYVTENAKGFYLCSQGLTAGGNVLKAQVIGNGRASVQHDDHLVFIPNKALRDEYNYYETNVIEWVDVMGDIQTFDLEIRTHTDKTLTSTVGSAAPPFLATLVFECENRQNVFGADSLQYQQEAWYEAHRQN